MQKFFDCGIDLGTTNSCLSIPDNDHGFEIIENQADRMQVTPSAILINGKGRMLIGQRAYNSQKVGDLAVQFKRAMGTNKKVHFESTEEEKTPEELSAEILKQLRNDAESRLNRPIENVVITVPAAFKTLQSEATNKAGKLAGFKNIILLQEPIAAAVAYGAKQDAKNKHWMVFDYGGGTLDVAIISTMDNRLTVENSEGDNFFGGGDIDRLIYKQIVYKKLVEKGYPVAKILDENTNSGKSLVRKIQLDCENAKIELSKKESAIIEIFDVEDDNGNDLEFEYEITRQEFEALIADTVEKSIEIAKKALAGAKITASELDKIILVGGSTFIPLVRRRLAEEFQVPLESAMNPMTVVSAGAAIYASTSVIDVEETVELTDATHAMIKLTYDPISSEESVNVIGKIENIADVPVAKIRVDGATSEDFSGADWTSGWVDLLDLQSGIFDIDVFLQKKKMNHFKVYACDEMGTDIVIENPYFRIKHNENVLKTSAPPATMSIGVQIQNPKTGYDEVCILIKKNTPLPAREEKIFKLSRDFDPNVGDCIEIKIWEGENMTNPDANHSAGVITVQASAMDRVIPKGTEIDLTVLEDEDRKIHVSGYIPDFEYEIPEETLRAEAKVDMSECMDKIENRIKQTEVSIKKMKEQGVDVSALEEELEQVKVAYEDTYDLVDKDDQAVIGYVDHFSDIETKIIYLERKNKEDKKTNKENNNVTQARKQVNQWGNSDARDEMAELEEAYRIAETEDEKAFVAQKMFDLGFMAMTSNFVWLNGLFKVILVKQETSYTNYQKALYWKSQGQLAIDNKDTEKLRNAVFELLELMTASANQAILAYGADLTI